jgi:hypothetical protein
VGFPEEGTIEHICGKLKLRFCLMTTDGAVGQFILNVWSKYSVNGTVIEYFVMNSYKIGSILQGIHV